MCSMKALVVKSVCLAVLILFSEFSQASAIYQYMVPVGTRKAYLWIPPRSRQVKGIIFAMENMLERNWLEDPVVRAEAARCNLGIVWLSSGAPNDRVIGWEMTPGGADLVSTMLVKLARESGYREIEFAPLIVTGHSWNGRIAWTLTRRMPGRVIAAIPIRSYPLPEDLGFQGIPLFYIVGQTTELPEFSDGRPGDRDFYWPGLRDSAVSLRRKSQQNLIGVATVAGGTHTDWSDEQARLLALFIHKACQYRLPANSPRTGPVTLRPVDVQSGWLTDSAGMAPDRYAPAPYRSYRGNPQEAYWFFDGALARAAMAIAGDRKPRELQMPTFVDGDNVLPVGGDGYVSLPLHLESDGMTFHVNGGFLSAIPDGLSGAGKPLGHGKPAFSFRHIMGPAEQIGPHTFRIQFDRQRALTIMLEVEQPVDSRYRRAVQPAKIRLDPESQHGKPQTIHFPQIPNQSLGTGDIDLQATSDSGLPVSYYVDAGPAKIVENRLHIAEVPAGAKFPLKVTVVAYQRGRTGANAVQSAKPVEQTFVLTLK